MTSDPAESPPHPSQLRGVTLSPPREASLRQAGGGNPSTSFSGMTTLRPPRGVGTHAMTDLHETATNTSALAIAAAPYVIRAEARSDIAARESLLDVCFGASRHARICQRLRDGRLPAEGLAFAVEHQGKLVGT